jgi:hypothetical protein
MGDDPERSGDDEPPEAPTLEETLRSEVGGAVLATDAVERDESWPEPFEFASTDGSDEDWPTPD